MMRFIWFAIVNLAVFAEAWAAPPSWIGQAKDSRLEFQFKQAGNKERGRFVEFAARFVFAADDLANSSIDVRVDLDSVDTGDEDRDDYLRSAEMFAVERWPQAHFRTLSITEVADGSYLAKAELTIRDQTRQLDFPFTVAVDKRFRLQSRVLLRRLDFQVGADEAADTSFVADEVWVEVDVYANKP